MKLKWLALFGLLLTILNTRDLFASNTVADTGYILIEGYIENYRPTDTIKLLVWEHFFSNSYRSIIPYQEYSCYDPSGRFSFKVPNSKLPIRHLRLMYGTHEKLGILKPMFSGYFLIENNDRVYIHYKDRSETIFSGKDSAKYQCAFELGKARATPLPARFKRDARIPLKGVPSGYLDGTDDAYQSNIGMDRYLNEKLFILEYFKPFISSAVYGVLKNDLLSFRKAGGLKFYTQQRNRLIYTQNTYKGKSSDIVRSELTKFDQYFQNELWPQRRIWGLDSNLLAFSMEYLDYVTTLIGFKRRYKDSTFDGYHYITSTYSGELRDMLLAKYMLEGYQSLPDIDQQMTDALALMETRACISAVTNFVGSNRIGQKAYPFELSDEKGNMYRQTDFAGKVAVMDFWYTGCIYCAKYYRYHLSKVEETFRKDTNVVFITVSIDAQWEKFVASEKGGVYTTADAPNVINLNTGKLGSRHPIIKHYGIKGYPTPFLIGKDGKLYSKDLGLRKASALENTIRRALAE